MSDAWWLLLAASIYVCAHFALYVTVLRHVSAFRKERSIFFYHVVSFAALPIAAFAACAARPSILMLQASVGAVSLHGIYSMSFLEAWSLSQISYSIAILDAIETTPGLDLAAAMRSFSDTGNTKKASRLASLHRLRLIVMRNGKVVLAPRGRLVAVALSVLRWIANLGSTG